MNTANLQLEGLYLAFAAVNNALVEKGLLSRDELTASLRQAEETALGDNRVEDLNPANRDAIAFAARFLILANNMAGDGFIPSFSELAKMVGQTKPQVSDGGDTGAA